MTQRIEIFLQKVSKNGFLECDSKNWNFPIWHSQNWTSLFSNMTHRIEHLFSRIWRTELNISFLEYDAQNWTSHLFSNMTHRFFFWIWLTELNVFLWYDPKKGLKFCDMIQRSEFFWYDSQNLTLFNITRRLEPFSPIDSKNWTFFSKWLKEVNFFIWQNMTQRFDFFCYDSKNRTLFWMWLKELNLFF